MSQNNNSKMVAILRRLKPEMHGAVVEDMARRGIRYGLSYGVAVPVIRRVAGDYAPDHALAEYLFQQDIRELQIAAVYIDEPEKVTAEQMERWTGMMPQAEIMEHAAMNLFYASAEAPEIIEKWLATADSLQLKGALYMAGRRAQKRMAQERELTGYIRIAEKVLPGKQEIPSQAAVHFFTRIAHASLSLRDNVGQVLHKWQTQSQPELKELASEIRAFLDA